MAWFAALQVQDLAKTILRGEKPIEEWTDAQRNAAFPTPQEFLEGILLEIVSQLKWQRRHGFHEQQQELFETTASVAWALEEKRSEQISANQPEPRRLEEDAEASEQETPPQRAEPLPPQQSLAAQPLALLSPPEEVVGDEHEGVMVSKNMVVEIGGVMACDGGKGMMESMQMDKEEELREQQPNQQQPQLSGAADPDPWPPPMSAGLDESNIEWEIGSHDFPVFGLVGRATAGSFAFGKCEPKGGESDREQESDWKQKRNGTGWSFSIFGGWGHETPVRRLTRPRRTRVRGKR